MRPSSTTTRSPPTFAATTGVPHAAASSATRPNDSERDGHDAHVGGAVVGGELFVGLGRHEADPRLEPELLDEVVRASELGLALRTARPADHEEPARGVVEPGERFDREVDALEWLDAPDEQQDGMARRAAARAGPSAWSPGEKSVASTPCGTMTTRSGSAP